MILRYLWFFDQIKSDFFCCNLCYDYVDDSYAIVKDDNEA